MSGHSQNTWRVVSETLKRNAMPLRPLLLQILDDLNDAERTINPERLPIGRLDRLVHLTQEQFQPAKSLARVLDDLQTRLGYRHLQSQPRCGHALYDEVSPSYAVWRSVPTALWIAVPCLWVDCLTLGVEARLTGMAKRSAAARAAQAAARRCG